MNLIASRINLLYGLLFINIFSFSQTQKIVFDIQKTSDGKFNSYTEISESFLEFFLSSDSSNYSIFYNKDFFCSLIEEEIMSRNSAHAVNIHDLCQDSIINEIFKKTISFKRKNLINRGDFFRFNEVEVRKISAQKKKTELPSQYKFELYNLYLHFKHITTNRKYLLSIFDVYHVNYKWYILDASFEILSE